MTEVAVTGASGFLGTHVVAALVERGASVTAVSRRARPTMQASNGVRWVRFDLASDPVGVYDKLGRPDVLVHLAWEGLPNYRSASHLDVELPRQLAFSRALVAEGLPALVVAGTCLEYGMQEGALSETTPTAPTTSYAEAKDRLRRHLELLRDEYPFRLTWARLFYTYGDGQAESSLYPQLRRAIASGADRFDMSGGEQVRDFLPVAGVAAHLADLALLRSDAGVVNVCSGQPVTVRALVERWLADNGWSIPLNLGHYPYPDYEPMAFWGDPMKLNTLLTRDADEDRG